MEPWAIISRSPGHTRAWGFKLGKLLQGGEIIGLVGDLGAGKTCFVRGLAEGLEVSPRAWIRSPTFTLVNEYDGRLPIYHIDLYRLERADEFDELNLRDYLYSSGISVIEWFDYLPVGEVDDHLEIRLAYGKGAAREVTFTPHGDRYQRLVRSLRHSNHNTQNG